MMRKILFLVLLMSMVFSAKAQFLKGRVTSDSEALPLANVLIYGSTDSSRPVLFLVTDSTGGFQGKLEKNGNYTVKVNLIGFKNFERKIQWNGADMDLGDIDLKLLNNNLKEVTVTARKKMIQRTTTGFVVQTDAVLTQAGGTATDLLSNIPTVLVDAEGGITIRGKAPMVLVNGRNSNLGNNLQRIPASSIEKIEIVNNPGAKYDADGEGGVINIVLKKDMRPGTNGAIAIGGGMGAKERLNSSLLLNHREGQVNFGLGYDNRFAKRTRQVFTDRETFAADEGHFLSQSRHDDRTEQTQNVKLNVDYGNSKNEFGFEGIFGYDQTHNYEPLYTRSFYQDGSFDFGSLRISDERQVGREWEGNLNYNRKFANARKLLTANLSHSYGNEDENTNISSSSINDKGDTYGDEYLQVTKNKEMSNVTTGRLDMAFPLSKRAILETGYKGIWRHINADFISAYKEGEIYWPDPLTSNIFDFQEQIQAVYGTYKSSFGTDNTWKYELGLRLEQWSNTGDNNRADSAFSNNYFNFFPTANLSYKLKDGSQLRVNLGRRVNRPRLGQLNPFVDITDSLNRHGGNPYLQPELVNTAELGWNKDWNVISVSGALFYRRGTNTILPYTTLLPGGIALTIPENIGSSTTYGLEGFISTQGGKIWNSTASVSLYNQTIKGNIDGEDIGNTVFSWYGKWANNFTIGKNLRAQILFNYQAPTAITQGTRLAVYNMDLGAQQKIMQGRARIGLTVTDVFNTLQNGSNVYNTDFTIKRSSKSDTRAVMLTFAMTFGSAFKEKLMENKFSAE